MTKQEIRNIIKQRRQSYSASSLMKESLEIVSRLETLPEILNAKTVAIYWPLPDEVNVVSLVEKLSEMKNLVLPVMIDGNDLEFRRYTKGEPMNKAAFSISEPKGDVVPYGEIDLIVVPGVAFDLRGNRLGRGKGFYDRFLKHCQATKVGICFEFQIVDQIPTEKHDIPMDIVLSSKFLP